MTDFITIFEIFLCKVLRTSGVNKKDRSLLCPVLKSWSLTVNYSWFLFIA